MLDKKKLMEYLNELATANSLSQAFYGIDAVRKEVNKGTFDITELTHEKVE